MSVLYTSTYSIAPGVDLTSATAESINSAFANAVGPSYASARDARAQEEVNDSVTSTDDHCIILDRLNRKLIHQRLYTTLEAAQGREAWIISNIPSSLTDYTRDQITLEQDAVMSQRGYVTIN